jgi:biotin carboxylase
VSARAPADEAKTVLVVGAGRQQARPIRRARQLGLRVVAVDGDPAAPGLAEADVGEHVDFKDVDGVVAAARRHRVDGVLTIAAEQAVPVVAAVAAALGLPGIGTETAHVMTNKIAMRRRLDEAGVPQPRFAEARSAAEAASVLRAVGVPAVVKPADSSGQRGLSLVGSPAELDGRVEDALGQSTAREAIVERFHAGSELNHLVVARDGRYDVVAQSDRVRPEGAGFGVAVTHVFPSTLPEEAVGRAGQVALDAVRALGLRDGIGYPQVLVTGDGEPLVMEVAARIPGGQMADLVR